MLRPVRLPLLLACAVLAVGLQAVRPAVADACPAPGTGGVSFPRGGADDDILFRGKGWGHGVGMSQYGAQGAASLGCSSAEIIGTYYPGVAIDRLGSGERPSHVVVGLRDDVTDWTHVSTASNDSVAWQMCDRHGNKCTKWWVRNQQPGTTWRVRSLSDGSFEIVNAKGTTYRIGDRYKLLRLRIERNGIQVDTTIEEIGRTTRWGFIQFDSHAGTSHGLYATNHIDAGRHPALDRYLWGLAEIPSSWPQAAVRAQVIAARSYAARRVLGGIRAECRCHLYATVRDQHWLGVQQVEDDQRAGGGWRQAVDATSNKIGRVDGTIAQMFYSSSSGGHTERSGFVFANDLSYLPAVDDSRWEKASTNPYRQWKQAVDRGVLGRRAGVGRALRVDVPSPHGESGRVGEPGDYGGVRIVGTEGTVTRSGQWARTNLGLRSTLFRVSNPRLGGRPISGDWDGDGRDDPGYVRGTTFILWISQDQVLKFRFGRRGDIPVAGDWDGDGVDTIGYFRPSESRWGLRNENAAGPPHLSFKFGKPWSIPVTGDWNGAGVGHGAGGRGDGVGVVNGYTWNLSDAPDRGVPDHSFRFARPDRDGVKPLTGDWNADSRDTVGVVNTTTYRLRNALAGGPHDIEYRFGKPTHRMLVGSWDGVGDSAGTVDWVIWRLRHDNQAGPPDRVLIADR